MRNYKHQMFKSWIVCSRSTLPLSSYSFIGNGKAFKRAFYPKAKGWTEVEPLSERFGDQCRQHCRNAQAGTKADAVHDPERETLGIGVILRISFRRARNAPTFCAPSRMSDQRRCHHQPCRYAPGEGARQGWLHKDGDRGAGECDADEQPGITPASDERTSPSLGLHFRDKACARVQVIEKRKALTGYRCARSCSRGRGLGVGPHWPRPSDHALAVGRQKRVPQRRRGRDHAGHDLRRAPGEQAVDDGTRGGRPLGFGLGYAGAPAAKGRGCALALRSGGTGSSKAAARCASTVLYQVRYCPR